MIKPTPVARTWGEKVRKPTRIAPTCTHAAFPSDPNEENSAVAIEFEFTPS